MNLYSFFTFILLCLFLSILMISLSFFLSKKESYLSKLSTYECGFVPFHKPSNPFSMSFFLMGILFLMFDLEIVLLFPWAIYSKFLLINHQFTLMIFMLFLILGLWYEWIKGGLDWQ